MSKPVTNKFLPLALIVLAAAIGYFAFALHHFSRSVPAFMVQVEQSSQSVSPAIDEIPNIVESIDNVTRTIPILVDEAKAYRLTIPEILAEAQAYRAQLPALIERLDRIQSQVTALHKDLPAVLTAVENSNQQVSRAVDVVPKLLNEMALVREDIPKQLTRIEGILSDSKDASQDVGKNMVSGVFEGVIYAPFGLLKDLSVKLTSGLKHASQLTDDDLERVIRTTKQVLLSESDEALTWQNPQSGNSGVVETLNRYEYRERPCKTVRFRLDMSAEKGGASEQVVKDFCKDAKNQWVERN